MRKLVSLLSTCKNTKSISVLALLLLLFTYSCTNQLEGQSSSNPFGNQQIVLNGLPLAIFGNACSISEIEALFNELLTINGSTIRAEIFSNNLPFELRGCITFADPVVINGRAVIDYLGGPVIGLGLVGTVNVSVTSILPNGEQQSNFIPISIVGVDIVSVDGPDMVTTNPTPLIGQPLPPPVFATITVNTSGILPGTFVSFSVTDPALGFLSDATAVLGSVLNGIATGQYNAFNGIGGTQTIIITIILPDPRSKSLNCDSVPVEARTIQAAITFEQIVPPTPSPTPTPTPAPPTPTPTSAPMMEVNVNNPTLQPGGNTIVEATVFNIDPLVQDVCCDIPIQSNPLSMLGNPPTTTPVCGLSDVTGSFFVQLIAGVVGSMQTILVRCCIDNPNGMCEAEEIQDSVQVTIEPGEPPPASAVEIEAADDMPPAGGTTFLNITTTPPVPQNTSLCAEIIGMNTAPPSMLDSPLNPVPDVIVCEPADAGGAVLGLIRLLVANFTSGQDISIRACIDLFFDDSCAGDPVSTPIILDIQ